MFVTDKTDKEDLMFLQSQALKIEEKARIKVNGAILPPLMHVRDDTACSDMTTLFSPQGACPSLSQGLVWPWKAMQ